MSNHSTPTDLEAEDLAKEYGHWGEHPHYPVADWQAEVLNDETRLGYWYWVEGCLHNLPDTYDN
jgi:hypothetical protein